MNIDKIGEFGLIDRIKKIVADPVIGDDTAPLIIGGETYLTTVDILLEDQHFLRNYPAYKVGYKAISINVSDIVASGGHPLWALVSLMLPNIETKYVDELYRGMTAACRFYGLKIVGGNITRSIKIGIDVFMIGKTKKFIGRTSVKNGDNIFLTGTLGDSKAGLELLLLKKKSYEDFEKKLIEKHLSPKINFKVADYLCSNASAALDISDGLSSDLSHLGSKSKIRIDIKGKNIPISKELIMFCKKYKHNPIEYAVAGGEDYQILFTQNLKSNVQSSKYFLIGKVSSGHGIYLDNKKLENKSFHHF